MDKHHILLIDTMIATTWRSKNTITILSGRKPTISIVGGCQLQSERPECHQDDSQKEKATEDEDESGNASTERTVHLFLSRLRAICKSFEDPENREQDKSDEK